MTPDLSVAVSVGVPGKSAESIKRGEDREQERPAQQIRTIVFGLDRRRRCPARTGAGRDGVDVGFSHC